ARTSASSFVEVVGSWSSARINRLGLSLLVTGILLHDPTVWPASHRKCSANPPGWEGWGVTTPDSLFRSSRGRISPHLWPSRRRPRLRRVSGANGLTAAGWFGVNDENLALESSTVYGERAVTLMRRRLEEPAAERPAHRARRDARRRPGRVGRAAHAGR